jgi:hypothetical protein
VVNVIKVFQKGQKEEIALMGMPGSAHQTAAEEAGVKFIAGLSASCFYDSLADRAYRMVR